MQTAVVVVLAAMAGSDERSLAESVASALRARGLRTDVAAATPTIELGARLAAVDEAYGAMESERATRLAESLVRDIEGPAGARLSSDEIAFAFARRALVARLAADSEVERTAIVRTCAAGALPALSEADYPDWLRGAVREACDAAGAGPRGLLRVEAAASGAIVRVDGALRGPAPAVLEVPAGTHVVHVVAPDADPFGTVVSVEPTGATVRAPAAAGYSHRVLVRRGEDGVLYLRIQLTTQAAGGSAREIATSGRDLTSAEVDSIVSAIAPRTPERRAVRRDRPRRGLPAWMWIAAGAAVVAAGGVGVFVATSESDEWRGVVRMP